MILSKSYLQELTEVAIAAAKEAGAYISSVAQNPLKVEKKVAGESLASQVVTEIDRESQTIILSKLLSTSKKYDLGLLTEELEDDKSRFIKDYFWCVDPLDGTLPFTEGSPGYAVSIALVSKTGVPVLGVVYDPFHKNVYHGIFNSGAFKNDQLWSIQPSDSNEFTFITDRSFLTHPLFEKVNERLKVLGAVKTIQHGGAVINALWVAEQHPACYFKFPKETLGGGSLWDYAATSCILTELGINVSDSYGNSLDLNRVDSTFLNHKGIAMASNERLKKLVNQLFKEVNR